MYIDLLSKSPETVHNLAVVKKQVKLGQGDKFANKLGFESLGREGGSLINGEQAFNKQRG